MVFCGTLVLCQPAPARAECTTQGALAQALAELLKLPYTDAVSAARALEGLGVAPAGGMWDVTACLTPDAEAQIKAAYGAVIAGGGHSNMATGAVDAALEALRPLDRNLKDVSPSQP
jgi:hypothetical protein